MKSFKVQFEIIGGVPALVADEAFTEDDAKHIKTWFETVRKSETAFVGTSDGIRKHGAETDPLPATDARHGVTVTVGGEFSDITRDGFVIAVDDAVARGIVHAVGHMLDAHHDALPFVLLASIMKADAAREFNGLAKLASELVKQGVENVEVGGVPVVRNGKVSDEFVPS